MSHSNGKTVMDPLNLFILNDGNVFPLIGFGTFRIQGRERLRGTVEAALKAGYRSFDTAAVYNNETELGAALKELLPRYNLTRKDIFLTSKLSPADQGGGRRTEAAVLASIERLQCEYLDLYLIHWPGAAGLDVSHPENARLRLESWATLVKLKKKGFLKSIGVSNYTVRHLRELIGDCKGELPAVNQVEWHPHYHQEDIAAECQGRGMLLQAYCSLGGQGATLLQDKSIQEVAKALGRTPSQVLLRWALQRYIAIIPKAESPQHIKENISLDFIIPEHHMEVLNSLPVTKKYAWNPNNVV